MTKANPGLSIIIPAYNAENWIDPTTAKIDAAAKIQGVKVELIIVDDGSTDSTYQVAKSLKLSHISSINILTHTNWGRFLNRKCGVEAAKYDTILFVDSRVWVDENSLSFLMKQQKNHPERIIWNGHINVAKRGNIIARFGDALTCIGWRRYFSNPKLTSYGIKDFDFYPKGTGLFYAPKHLLIETIAWFESVTNDVKNSSDDTLMIRHIAETNRIWLSPEFSATYFARTSLGGFVKHTYFRGQYFVDGFLRKGTRFYWQLIAFLLLCPLALVVVVLWPILLLGIPVVVLTALLLGVILGLHVKDAAAFAILSPVFTPVYTAGIYRGYIRYVMGSIRK
jgi:glycosyltransferase involved in cell wall biosynthesis